MEPVEILDLQKPRTGYLRNPWRKARVLQALTVGYLAWSILPVTIAILVSFTSGRSRAIFQPPLSLRWWIHDDLSVWKNPEYRVAIKQTLILGVLVVLIAVPIGLCFALAMNRWRGRGAQTSNFFVLLTFVVPELILGTSLLLFFSQLVPLIIPGFKLGTAAQVLGLVTFQINYPVIIIRSRLFSIGRHYEEAAMDLGASPMQSLRKVLLPMLYPAIFVSAVLVFADVIDDFVIVRYLSLGAATEPMSVKVYTAARGSPVPAVNAMATIMLITTFVVVALGAVAYAKFSNKDGGSTVHDIATQL
jgi:spermidine/putrescine transport system permease protein